MSDHRLALVLLTGLPRSGDAMTRLLLVRHGRTEMNEWMSKPGKGWGAPGFVDPALWDTRLTPTGEMQARELNSQMRSWHPEVDLLLASPLRRALATAEIGFDGVRCQTQRIEPLAAERCFLSSDVGSPITELQRSFSPAWGFETLPERWWFQGGELTPEWRPPGTYVNPGEDSKTFYARMARLIEALRACAGEHETVALVAHWGVLNALTGRSFKNCEWSDQLVSDLPDTPFVAPD